MQRSANLLFSGSIVLAVRIALQSSVDARNLPRTPQASRVLMKTVVDNESVPYECAGHGYPIDTQPLWLKADDLV